VDYKTGEPGGEAVTGWNRQLARYRTLLQQCTGFAVTTSAIYQPGADRFVELPDDS
jgi:hypothetical protein